MALRTRCRSTCLRPTRSGSAARIRRGSHGVRADVQADSGTLPRGLALSGTGVTVATTVSGACSIPYSVPYSVRRPRFLALAYPAQGRFGLLLRLVLAVAPRAARAVLI